MDDTGEREAVPVAAARAAVGLVTGTARSAYEVGLLAAGTAVFFLPLYAGVGLASLLPGGELRDVAVGWLLVLLPVLGVAWMALSGVPEAAARKLLLAVTPTSSRRVHDAVDNIVGLATLTLAMGLLFEGLPAAALAAAITTAGYLAAAPLLSRYVEADHVPPHGEPVRD